MAASGSLENPHVQYEAWHYHTRTFLSERAIMGMQLKYKETWSDANTMINYYNGK